MAYWQRLVRDLHQDRNPGFRSTDDVEEQIKNVEGDRGIPRGKGQMSHTLSVACRTERESPKGPAWSNHSSPLLQSGQSLWFWGEGRECEEWGERWLLKSFTFTSSYIHSLLNQWVKYQRPVECRFPCLMNLLDSVFYLGPQ